MSIEGFWRVTLRPSIRPDGQAEGTPYFSMIIRAAGAGLELEMIDDRGAFLPASKKQLWVGAATATGARFDLPLQLQQGPRTGDFRVVGLSDATRADVNLLGLTRRLDLVLDDERSLTGAWQDHWFLTEFRDGESRLTKAVPRLAEFTAVRSNDPICWHDASGTIVTEVVSGTAVRPRLAWFGPTPSTVEARVTWGREEAQLALSTANDLSQGYGPTLVPRVLNEAEASARAESPGVSDVKVRVVRVPADGTLVARCFGSEATLTVRARETRRTLKILRVEANQEALQQRWARAIAPLKSRLADLEGSVLTLREDRDALAEARAKAQDAVDQVVSALEAEDGAYNAASARLDQRVAALKASNRVKLLIESQSATENGLRDLTRWILGDRVRPDGTALPSPMPPGSASKQREEALKQLTTVTSALFKVLDDDADVKKFTAAIAEIQKKRSVLGANLAAAVRTETRLRDQLLVATRDLGYTEISRDIAKGRLEQIDAAGPRLVRVQWKTSDGVAFDAGSTPDPVLVAHFRALLAEADARLAEAQADHDAQRDLLTRARTAQASLHQTMLDAFLFANAAGDSVAITIRRNAYFRLGIHVAADVFELSRAAAEGPGSFVFESAFKLYENWSKGGSGDTKTYDESALRAQFAALRAPGGNATGSKVGTEVASEVATVATLGDYWQRTDKNATLAALNVSIVKQGGRAGYEAAARLGEAQAIERGKVQLLTAIAEREKEARALALGTGTKPFLRHEALLEGIQARLNGLRRGVAASEDALSALFRAEPLDQRAIQAANRKMKAAKDVLTQAEAAHAALCRYIGNIRAQAALVDGVEAGLKRIKQAVKDRRSGGWTVKGAARDVLIDQIVRGTKDWVDVISDDAERDAWIARFEADLLYGVAVLGHRQALKVRWLAEEAVAGSSRRLEATKQARLAPLQRHRAYLAELNADNDLPTRLNVEFMTDAQPMSLALTVTGSGAGYTATMSGGTSDGDASQTHLPLVSRAIVALTAESLEQSLSSLHAPVDVPMSARRLEEAYEDGDTLVLHVTMM